MLCRYLALCAFALGYCWSQFAHAEIPFEQVKGIYEATREDQKENSPLWGMVALKSKVLERIRFFGPYNTYSDKTNIFANEREMQNHLKLLGLWAEQRPWQQVQDVPQDFVSALIQCLFPSPDGAIFVANERRGDPLVDLIRNQSGINLTKLNHLMETLLAFKTKFSRTSTSSKDWEQLRVDIFNLFLLPPPAQTKQERTEAYHQRVIAKKKNLEEIQKQQGRTLQRYEWKPLLKQRKQEGKQLISSRYDVYNHKISTLNLKNDNDRKIFLALHLSHILAGALQQELEQKKLLYPENIVMIALQAYAWKVANNKRDLKTLTVVIKPESLTADQSTSEDYLKNKDSFFKLLREQKTSVSPEQIAFFREGYEAYEEIIPSLISYKTRVKYINEEGKEQTYPDCGETSLRNFLYIMLNEKGTVNLKHLEDFIKKKLEQSSWSPPNPSKVSIEQEKDPLSQLYLYFHKYPSTSVAGTETAHNDWSQIVSDLNRKRQRLGSNQEGLCQISYGGYSRCQECEIDAGLINMLNVIANLIPDKKLNEPWKPQESERLNQAAEKLNRLCELFSRKDFELEWDINKKQKVPKNTGITITFAINGNDAFEWHVNPMHFEIRKSNMDTFDWIRQISWSNQNIKIYPLLQAWFTQSEDLADYQYQQNAQPFWFFGQDLRNNDIVTNFVHYLFSRKYQAYYPSAIKLLRPFFQDSYSLGHIKAMMLGHPEQVDLFSDEEQKQLVVGRWWEGSLIYIMRYGYLSSLKQLIKQDKKILKRTDHNDSTLLHGAASRGYTDMVELLLENEANIDAENTNGYTPLHFAAKNGYIEVVKLLLEKGARVRVVVDTSWASPPPYPPSFGSEKWTYRGCKTTS